MKFVQMAHDKSHLFAPTWHLGMTAWNRRTEHGISLKRHGKMLLTSPESHLKIDSQKMLIQKPSTANPLIHHHIFFISFNHLFQQIAAATSMAPIFFGLASPLCACPRMKRDSPENVGKTDRTASQEERIV